LLPHLSPLKSTAQLLQLRAIAELQNGEIQKALGDVRLLVRLAESVSTEPMLISQLIRIALLQIALQPVYEGLAEHRWSDAQLAERMLCWRGWISSRITGRECAAKWC
jgi:hypothetical protein